MAVGLACFRYRWHGHVVLVPCFLLFLLVTLFLLCRFERFESSRSDHN